MSMIVVHSFRAQTALHKAAWYGYRGICKILVEAGASLLRTDYQVETCYVYWSLSASLLG